MFISLSQIQESLEELQLIHPFYGITFLVFKRDKLPVGHTTEFPINSSETGFLRTYYHIYEQSDFFFRVFRVSYPGKVWVARTYASSTLQSSRTREFKDAFIHTKNTNLWGWKPGYVDILRSNLVRNKGIYRNRPVPAFHLAVWLYRQNNWGPNTKAEEIVAKLASDFYLTPEEQRLIFDISIPESAQRPSLFQDKEISRSELQAIIGRPPDVPPGESGTLVYLGLKEVGPVDKLQLEPAERINLITGDNGLGKTFLLECAWWALTGQWAELQAYPRPDVKASEPQITFHIAGTSKRDKPVTVRYDYKTQSWPSREGLPTLPGLLIYARVDGSFAVWDPARSYWASMSQEGMRPPGLLLFTKDDVWNGLHGSSGIQTHVYCNGLLQDWINWQSTQGSSFQTFKKVLNKLSPDDLAPLEPGRPVRLPFDVRDIPTLKHAYGEVPILHAAAGVKRIVAMAYLIVWAWHEHNEQSKLIQRDPEKRMAILIDEIEAHLHPKWQRLILPSLIEVSDALHPDLNVQFLIATHSPLIMASLEPLFNPNLDKLFHLDLVNTGMFDADVRLTEKKFVRRGPIDSWLTSDVFELRHARSLDAEKVIEEAKRLQLDDNPSSIDVQRVSDQLVKLLAGDDEFWPRWKYFAEQHGARL